MKRIATVSLVGALTLGMLVSGVAAANQGGGSGTSKAGGIGNVAGFGAWARCVLTPAVSRTAVFAHATPASPGGSIKVEVKVIHSTAGVTPYSANVTPTFPNAGAGQLVTLTRSGTSFVLKGKLPVPSTATAGSATLTVAGLYGTSSFACANFVAKIKVPAPSKAPVCTSTPTGLDVHAYATPAMPGGTLWVAVLVKKQDPSATLSATASATIPGAAPAGPVTLTALPGFAVLAGALAVGTTATLGGTATVSVSGTYTLASGPTTFTCSLSTPIKSVKFWE